MRNILTPVLFIFVSIACPAREYHVAKNGNDAASGDLSSPLLTINTAAQRALPGDTVTVYAGTYREWVDPLRGGRNEDTRILYRAAEGEFVELKGSERVSGWKKVDKKGSIWSVTVPNEMFGTFNPFAEAFVGDWLIPDYTLHLGDVYLNGLSLYEAESRDSLQVVRKSLRDPDGCTLNWFAEVRAEGTVIYANFDGRDPNAETVEVSVRPTCFYPSREGINYITFRGFHVSQAATRWGAPTAEQVGMVSTHWSRGWIIEHNVLKNSKSSGITLGKESSTGQDVWTYDKRLDGSVHYIECIFRALNHGWNRETVGHNIVRDNVISDCGQAGICGSMCCAFSEIYGNHIYDIDRKGQYVGAEQGGIKLHCAIDTYVHGNCVHGATRGIWLDWMGQGARVSSNLLYDNVLDLYFEMDHGPYMADNNILLSEKSLWDMSEGGAFVNNLFKGQLDCSLWNDPRYIPYCIEHSSSIKGVCTMDHSDTRVINNVFLSQDAQASLYNYTHCAVPGIVEDNIILTDADIVFNPQTRSLSFKGFALEPSCLTVDANRLGRTHLSDYAFENADGTPMCIDIDFFGNARHTSGTFPGPFGFNPEGAVDVAGFMKR